MNDLNKLKYLSGLTESYQPETPKRQLKEGMTTENMYALIGAIQAGDPAQNAVKAAVELGEQQGLDATTSKKLLDYYVNTKAMWSLVAAVKEMLSDQHNIEPEDAEEEALNAVGMSESRWELAIDMDTEIGYPQGELENRIGWRVPMLRNKLRPKNKEVFGNKLDKYL